MEKNKHGSIRSAVVLFSGGQDSTTCLAWAIREFKNVVAISFDYSQKHLDELVVATKIADRWGINQKIVRLNFLKGVSRSALMFDSGIDINHNHPENPDLPASFVPNRNTIFLTIAHAYCQFLKYDAIVIGANQVDYSGYPDCRKEFLLKIEEVLNLGSDSKIKLLAPLIDKTKGEIFLMADKIGVLDDILNNTITCYRGDQNVHVWGKGCGDCAACNFRAIGFEDFKFLKSQEEI